MSINLPSNRYPYQHPDPHTDNGFRLLFNANTDVQQAIVAMNAKVVALTSQVTTATTTVTTTKASTPSTGGSFPVNVNEQTADYVLQQTDVAGLNYFTGTGPYALELNVGVVRPFYTSVLNLSSGAITATPTSGSGRLVNNLSSVTIPTTLWTVFYWDGINWWAEELQIWPQTIAPSPGLVVDGYDATTGLFHTTAAGGSGTVTSVALTMPTGFSVGGSPVTTAGTLAVTLDNENANYVWAGPTTGSPAPPTFRAIVAGDIPSLPYVPTSRNVNTTSPLTGGGALSSDLTLAVNIATSLAVGVVKPDNSTITVDGSGVISAAGGSGTVTSVGLTMPTGFSVSGSPVTGAGTLAVTLSNETANFVWAGPTTGSPAPPTFRALVAGDIPALAYVTGTGLTSAQPVFGGGSSAISIGTKRGNTTVAQMADNTTAPTTGHLAVFDANGNITDGGAPAGGSLTVASTDGSVSVSSVTTIKVPNGTLTNLTGGVVSIDPAAAATPYSVPGLILWCSADKISGLVDGNSVTRWIDYSSPQGGGPGLTSAWSSTSPIYKTGIVNSLPIVRFGGTGWMRGAQAFDNYQWSVFMVFKMSSLSPSYSGIIGWSVGSDQGGYFVKSNGKSALYPASASNYDGTGAYTFGTVNFQVVSVLYDGQNFYTRAALAADQSVATQTPPGFPRNFLFFNQNVSSRVATGDVAEVLMYNWYVGSTNISTIENYLKTKYAL
jgi:hypothetical protein